MCQRTHFVSMWDLKKKLDLIDKGFQGQDITSFTENNICDVLTGRRRYIFLIDTSKYKKITTNETDITNNESEIRKNESDIRATYLSLLIITTRSFISIQNFRYRSGMKLILRTFEKSNKLHRKNHCEALLIQ